MAADEVQEFISAKLASLAAIAVENKKGVARWRTNHACRKINN